MKLQRVSLYPFAVAFIFCCNSALASELETSKNATELIVGNRTVLNSWQSSGQDRSCFWGRSAEEESTICSGAMSFWFFHSEGKLHLDNGYHWFVLQLNSSAYITAISIKGRNDTVKPEYIGVYNRAAGIEIWTSPYDVNFSGADHCSANNLSIYFIRSRNEWSKCGVTRASNGNVKKGEILTVNCTAQVKMLMLRRFIGNNTVDHADYMSFGGITLTIDPQPVDSSDQTGLIIACLAVFALLCILSSVIFFIWWRRRHNQSGSDSAPGHLHLNTKPFSKGQSTATVDTSVPATDLRETGGSRYDSNITLDQQVLPDGTVDECSYATVRPMAEVEMASSEVDFDGNSSECTVYLSIIGDGDVSCED